MGEIIIAFPPKPVLFAFSTRKICNRLMFSKTYMNVCCLNSLINK